MKYIKLFFAVTIPLILLSVLLFVGSNIFVSTRFSDSNMRDLITSFVETNFNKAVRFDSVKILPGGGLRVVNLKVSAFDDFNDNSLLIDAPSADINLDYIELLNGNIEVRNITFKGATFSLHKQYDADYSDTFSILSGVYKKYGESEKLAQKKARLLIKNSTFRYTEIFKSETVTVAIEDFNVDLSVSKEVITVHLDGMVTPYKTPLAKSSFTLDSRLLFKGGEYLGGRSRVRAEMLDLSYLSPYLQNRGKNEYELAGGISGSFQLNSFKGSTALVSDCSFSGLSLKKLTKELSGHTVVSNKDLDMQLALDLLDGGKRILLHKLRVSDENGEFAADAEYVHTENNQVLKSNFQCRSSNLEKLSLSFMPIKDYLYEGSFQCEGALHYDFMHKRNYLTNIRLKLDDFAAYAIADGKKEFITKDASLHASVSYDKAGLTLKGKTGDSDYTVSLDSIVSDWEPFSSTTNISLRSEKLEAGHVASFLKKIHGKIERFAIDDAGEGYDGVMFPDLPYGKPFIHNTVLFSTTIDNLSFGGKSAIKNISLKQRLKDRMLETESFSASGYGAAYDFSLRGNLKNDFVHFRSGLSVTNFDLAQFYRDLGARGSVEGVFDGSYSWKVNGYRLRDLVINNEAELVLELKQARIDGIPYIKRFNSYLETEGAHYLHESLDLSYGRFRCKQKGLYYHVSLGMASDLYTLDSYSGGYVYNRGYSVPLTATLKESAKASNKSDKLKLRMRGLFTSPYIVSNSPHSKTLDPSQIERFMLFN